MLNNHYLKAFGNKLKWKGVVMSSLKLSGTLLVVVVYKYSLSLGIAKRTGMRGQGVSQILFYC